MMKMDAEERYILIVGAMKSGTTTLFDMLASHPQIAPCSPKEPGFFAFEEMWALGFPWYHGLFEFDPAQHLYRLDGSTDYAKYPFCRDVALRLAASEPRKFKLIYIMRHPLRRIESHARHVQHNHAEVGRSRSPVADHGLDAGITPVNLAVSRYAMQLSQFGDLFARGDLLPLTLEQLVDDPEATLNLVLEFVGLPPAPLDLSPKNTADGQRQMPDFWQSILSSNLKWIGKFSLPKSAREAIKDKLRKPVRTEGRFKLTASEEARLTEELADDLRRLREEFGVDTYRWWGL